MIRMESITQMRLVTGRGVLHLAPENIRPARVLPNKLFPHTLGWRHLTDNRRPEIRFPQSENISPNNHDHPTLICHRRLTWRWNRFRSDATCLALFGGSCKEIWVSIRISPLSLGIVYLLSRARNDAAAGLEEASAGL